ncbi:MAG: hypothetical protein JWP91_417 [Fibrobacteres bacterium]|nr:hypothetical protein [Fibrobacterota bacterium]
MFQSNQRANGKKALSAGLSMVACVTAAALSIGHAADPVYTVGARTTVLGNGAGGLTQFPETPIVILQTTPDYRVLISNGLKTSFCTGPSMDKLTASPRVALAPSGQKGYDEVSAHITSIWKDPGSTDIYGVFNANDSDQVPRIPGPGIGFRGRLFSAGLAKSTDGGVTFTKIGPILSVPKNATADPLQGDAYATVVMDPTSTYLYLYYGDMYNAQLRHGVQTCVARATVASKGLPGSWKKYYNGDFVTPGNSILDTLTYTGAETDPVVTFPGLDSGYNGDAMYPHVVYSAKAKCYIMVYAVNFFDEIPPADSLGKFPPADRSGIWVSYSVDAVHWFGQHQLIKAISIDYPGREVAMHPTIVVDEAASTATSIKAKVYYGYNPNMWLGTPVTQYLVSQTVDVSGLGDLFSAGIVAPDTRHATPGYSILPGASGQWLMRFANGDVDGIRIVGIDGAAAGKALRVGEGRYQLQVSRSAGPVFLQGKQAGRTFSSVLRLP